MFSYAGGEIKAVGIATQNFQEFNRPSAFGAIGEQWDEEGWLVSIDWTILENPFSPKSNIAQIAPLLPKTNSHNPKRWKW